MSKKWQTSGIFLNIPGNAWQYLVCRLRVRGLAVRKGGDKSTLWTCRSSFLIVKFFYTKILCNHTGNSRHFAGPSCVYLAAKMNFDRIKIFPSFEINGSIPRTRSKNTKTPNEQMKIRNHILLRILWPSRVAEIQKVLAPTIKKCSVFLKFLDNFKRGQEGG